MGSRQSCAVSGIDLLHLSNPFVSGSTLELLLPVADWTTFIDVTEEFQFRKRNAALRLER